jgi:hypothetical protein
MKDTDFTYSPNVMGPINGDWIEENGSGWIGGRIDIYGGYDHYPDETELPIMSNESFNRFDEYLEELVTSTRWNFDRIRKEFEKHNEPLVLFREQSKKDK